MWLSYVQCLHSMHKALASTPSNLEARHDWCTPVILARER